MDDSSNKPQQTTQPVPGPVPTQPNGQPTQPVQYMMPPKKKLSKGALWGIIGGSIGLVLVIVGVVLAIIFLGGPSKDDYNEALSYMRNYKTTALDYNSYKAKSIDEIKETIDKVLSEADEYLKELGDKKAMRDSEVKKAYDEYKASWDKTRPIMEKFVKFSTLSSEISKKCLISVAGKLNYTTKTGEEVGAQFDQLAGDCKKTLDSSEKSDVKEVADYAKEYNEYLTNLRAYYVALANRYSSRNYSSPAPSYPKLPSGGLSNSMISLSKELSDSKVVELEKNLSNILEKKANA